MTKDKQNLEVSMYVLSLYLERTIEKGRPLHFSLDYNILFSKVGGLVS